MNWERLTFTIDNFPHNFTFGLVDIDDFRLINETYGYEFGNDILSKIESYLKRLSFIHFSYRLGDDEFIFSIDGEFDIHKHKIISIFSDIYSKFKLRVSMGTLTITQTFPHSTVYNQLKINLLEAKKNGKNLICHTNEICVNR